MARIRTIKPEFPQSETIGRLSRDARLLFVQLWTIVDDAGRARASSRVLASLLYPYDDDAKTLIDGWLCELSENRLLFFYTADDNSYLQITNWLKHQKIDRPSVSRIPAPEDGIREAVASPRESSMLDLGPRTVDHRTKDISSSLRSDDMPASPKPKRAKPKTKISETAQPGESEREAASAAGMSVDDFRTEWLRFRDYHLSRGSLMADWQAAWRTWAGNHKRFSKPAREGPQTNGRGGFASLLAKSMGMKNGRQSEYPNEAVSVLSIDYRGERGNGGNDDRQLSGDVIDVLAGGAS